MAKYLKISVKWILEKIRKELQYKIKLEQITVIDIT